MNNPGAIQLDLTRISEMGDGVIPALNELREQERVVWHEPARAWLVLRHDDVAAGFQGELPLSNRTSDTRIFRAIAESDWPRRIPRMVKNMPRWVLSLDRPDHSRLRGLLNKGFKRGTIERQRPFVHATIDRVLEAASGRDTVEFVEDISRPITGAVIMNLIGIPQTHHHRMKGWADALTAASSSARPEAETLDAAETAFREMEEVFLVEIARRRDRPSDDFLSELVHAKDDGNSLGEDELIAQLYLLLIAGHESTTNTVAMSTLALLRDEKAKVDFLRRADSAEAVLGPVLELMRYVAMATAMPRVAARDFEWHGKSIRKGDMVFLVIASANRDPRIFTDPERIDFDRDIDRTMTFGPGIHHCIGHLLAKMEVTEFLPRFLRRFPDAHAIEDTPAFTSGLFFRGIEALPLRLAR